MKDPADPGPGTDQLSDPPPATELPEEWRMGPEIFMDHAGTEISFRLQVEKDERSFTITFRDGQTRTVKIEGERQIKFVVPSVEGTVIWCQLIGGDINFYDVHDGRKLKEDELRRINPQFYC